MIRKLILYPCLLLFTSCHVGRFIIYNFADIRDNRKFPERKIKAAEVPFHFHEPQVNSLHPAPVKIKGREVPFEEALKKNGTVAFVVIRNDSVLYSWFQERFKNRTTPSFSVAKSVISALIGIAIQEGKIKSTDEPITNYLDFKRQKDFEKITVQDLLDMRSGIAFNEGYYNPFGDVAKFYYGRHLKRYCYHLKVKEKPGQRFEYISVNPQLLGLILEKATGMSVAQYCEEKLWKRMGTESDASWSIDRKNGNEKTFCCLNAKAKDLAKFGRLYLNKGMYGGVQVIPAEWVSRVTGFNGINLHQYNDQWWHTRRHLPVSDTLTVKPPYSRIKYFNKDGGHKEYLIKPSGDLLAEGILGQFIYVRPQSNMIIVRLGKKYGNMDWHGLFRKMTE